MATTNPRSPQNGSPVSSRPNTVWRSWWWIPVVALALGALVVFRPADDEDQKMLEVRRQHIAEMSATERERLEQNFERFEQLSPERQDDLREIEETITENEDLKSTLTQYERWLGTLSPFERMEIRKAESIEDKLEFVSTIVAARRQEESEKKDQDKQFSELITRSLAKFQWPGQRPGNTKRVSDNDLSGMMAVLDAQYGFRVKPNASLSPGCAAYNIQLLTEALTAQIQQSGLEKVRANPLPDEMMKKMIEQIPDEEIRALFDDWDSKKFVGYLAYKLESAWWSEAKQNPPSREELDEIAKTLGEEARSDFERKKQENSRWAYFQLLMATVPVTFYTETQELDEALVKLGIRSEARKPPGTGRQPVFWDRRGDGHRRGRGDHHRDDDDHDRSRRGRDNDDRRDKDNEETQSPPVEQAPEPPPPSRPNENLPPKKEAI